ncbi:MAG: efflux transporter outer membrane subunit [Rhodoferax sp.]|nr:efflux transporter outer membrane subunit [Rhodoferax sp.]MCF8208373.1 efflux transporter outer membrane subunit [Rhodoferax sp.]
MFRAVTLAAVVCLTACVQTQQFVRPDPPVPGAWPNVQPERRPEAAKVSWREYFADPQLRALIAAALEHNRDLRIAAARVEEARAQFGVTRSDRQPSVNLLGSVSAVGTPAELSGTGSTSSSRRVDITLSSVSYEVDFWGRLAGLSEVARTNLLATEESRHAVYLSLVADVASAYFTLCQMNELVGLAQSAVDSRAQTLDLVTKGRDLGGTYDLEVQQALGALESSRANLDGMEHQRTLAINRLNFLVGHAPISLTPGKALSLQLLDDGLAAGLPAEVLLSRPDVMAAEQRLLSAHANIGAARAAFLPKVLLTAGLGVASQGLVGLFRGGAWSFQPAISMPLFDGGRTAAGVDVAEARKVIAIAEYEKSIQLAFREVADLLSGRLTLASQLRASLATQSTQQKRLEIAQARHQAGLVAYLDVLEGERELMSAEQMVVQVRRAQLESSAQLFKALGGGNFYE